MAPNNGLATSKPQPQPTGNNNLTNSGSTTILPKGTVESRGNGTINSQDDISRDIQEFIHGEGRLSFWAEVRGFFTVWMFVTRLPGPTWVDHHPGYLMRGMVYFPISGTLIGIFVSTFYDLASLTLSLPLTISSIISEVTSIWVTGCFHEDGLADSADGIGGGWNSEQILKIMTDTRLGTYGCAILILYMIAKVELIAVLGKSIWIIGHCRGGGPAIIVTHTLSRLVAPILVKTRDYVDEQGPKYRFYSFFLQAKYLITWGRVLFALMTSFVVASIAYGIYIGALLIAAVILMAYFSGRYADYLLGGVMGDYLGATICITEVYLFTLILLVNMYEDNADTFVELETFFSGALASDLSFEKVMETFSRDPFLSLVKFVAVVIFTNIWCSNVGHPPVFVRKVSEKMTTCDETLPVSTDTEKKRGSFKKIPCETLETFLSDSSHTFTEQFNAVRTYIDALAKPVGSLGTLEDWASRLSSLQRTTNPTAVNVACLIFAGDHGVAKTVSEGGMNCSAYPQSVSVCVVQGLENGLAGASILSKCNGVDLRVIDVGLTGDSSLQKWSGKVVTSSENKVIGGTNNFCKGNAMTKEQVDGCMSAGRNETIKVANDSGCTVIVFGEVGIGNTTTSAALIAALTGIDPVELCGSGASTTRDGVNLKVMSNKVSIVKEAMQYHGASTMIGQPHKALKAVGGAEIAAIVGGILEASERNIAVLVDGFICTTAALIACHIEPLVSRTLLFATLSTEKGQKVAIDAIVDIARTNGIPPPDIPALQMNLRMGEATGALVAVPLLRSSCAILSIGTLVDVLNLGNETRGPYGS